MKSHGSGHEHITVPRLVDRCRHFQARLTIADREDVAALLTTFGITESINLPAHRPA